MRFLPGIRRTALVLCGGLLLTLQAEDPLPSADRLQSSPVLRHLKPNPVIAAPRTGPEQTVAQMHVPEGFRVEVVVAEPDLHQPVAFAWDELGRIWVAEAYSYPTKRPEGQGLDKLVIFSDTDGTAGGGVAVSSGAAGVRSVRPWRQQSVGTRLRRAGVDLRSRTDRELA